MVPVGFVTRSQWSLTNLKTRELRCALEPPKNFSNVGGDCGSSGKPMKLYESAFHTTRDNSTRPSMRHVKSCSAWTRYARLPRMPWRVDRNESGRRGEYQTPDPP